MLELGSDGWLAYVALLFQLAESPGGDDPAGDAPDAEEGESTLLGAANTLGALDEDPQVAVLELYRTFAPHVRECASALQRGATGHARVRVAATAPHRRADRLGASAASAASNVHRRDMVAVREEELLQLACTDGTMGELSALATGGGGRVHARTLRALLRLAVRLHFEDGDALGVPAGADVLALIGAAASVDGAGGATPPLSTSVRTEALRRAAALLGSSTRVSDDGLSAAGVRRAVQQLNELVREQSVTLAAAARLALPRLITRLLQLCRAGAPRADELLQAACQGLPPLEPLPQGEPLPASLDVLQRLLRSCGGGIERLTEWLGGSEVAAADRPLRREVAEARLHLHGEDGLLALLHAVRDDPSLGDARASTLSSLLFSKPGDADDDEPRAADDEPGDADDDEPRAADDEDEAMADEAASSAIYDEMRQLQGPVLDEVYDLLQPLASRAWRKAGFKQVFQRLLNVFRRTTAEALLRELQRNGAGLLTFLKAFNEDERLSHVRLRVLQQLFFLDVTHHEAGSEEATVDEATASFTLYDEMQRLQGSELNVVYALLEPLASGPLFKAGFKQVFQRLLTAGKAERLVLEQIQATVRAQQGGSSKPVPGNAATKLMLQDISRTENWTLAVRHAVARYDLIHRTRDIIETTHDLPLADARRLQGAHAHTRASSPTLPSHLSTAKCCRLSHCHALLPSLTRSPPPHRSWAHLCATRAAPRALPHVLCAADQPAHLSRGALL